MSQSIIQDNQPLATSPGISTPILQTAPEPQPIVKFDDGVSGIKFDTEPLESTLTILPPSAVVVTEPDNTPATRADLERILRAFTTLLPDGTPPVEANSAILRYHVVLGFGEVCAPIQVKGQHDFSALLLSEMMPEAIDNVSSIIASSIARPIVTRLTAMLAARAQAPASNEPPELTDNVGF